MVASGIINQKWNNKLNISVLYDIRVGIFSVEKTGNHASKMKPKAKLLLRRIEVYYLFLNF